MRLLIPLFSPATGTWGGLTRGIAVAEAARDAGHAVAFCASGYLQGVLADRGYRVFSIPSATMLGLPPSLSRIIEKRAPRATPPVRPGKSIGSVWLVLVFSGFARGKYLRDLVRTEIRAVNDFRADRIFTDLDPGAFLAAAVTGVPLASAYASISTHGSGTPAWRYLHRAWEKILRSYGRPARNPDQLYFGEGILKVIPSIPELDGTDPDRNDVCYVGHLLGPIQSTTDFRLEGKRRCMFVYVGTGSVSLGTLENVLPRHFPAGAETCCIVGSQGVKRPYRVGAVEFYPYVPAEGILSYCDWTICHGGQNTIIQSLLHGVPLIVFPGAIFERRFNARLVEENGAGFMGELSQFNEPWLETAFSRREDCAGRAARLAERLRFYGGAAAAVRAISSWEKEI